MCCQIPTCAHGGFDTESGYIPSQPALEKHLKVVRAASHGNISCLIRSQSELRGFECQERHFHLHTIQSFIMPSQTCRLGQHWQALCTLSALAMKVVGSSSRFPNRCRVPAQWPEKERHQTSPVAGSIHAPRLLRPSCTCPAPGHVLDHRSFSGAW